MGLRRFRYIDTILAYNYISATEKAQVSEILRRNICDLLRTDFSAFFFAQMEKISNEIGHFRIDHFQYINIQLGSEA